MFKKKEKIIAFSGLDCAGKSTQIDLLKNYLKNAGQKPLYLWTRGGYTTGFVAFKSLLRKTNSKALPAAGRSKARDQILSSPRTRKIWLILAILDLIRVYAIQIRLWKIFGKTIICDRYLSDTLIDFKLNFPNDDFENYSLWKLLVTLSPKPDEYFLLVIPVEESLKRSAMKDEPFPDTKDVLNKRLHLYKDIAGQNEWTTIDCRGTIDLVWAKIKTTIEN